MNSLHLEFLASPQWGEMLRTDLLPWVDSVGDLGDDVLEIGPGPGLTTDLMRVRVSRLTAIELDESLAAPLRERLAGSNVDVVTADATASGLADDRFSAATCFSMLHHMPSAEHQDALFAEVGRMLRPRGIFVGCDSLDLEAIRAGHVDDTFTPVDPSTFAQRLAAAGFQEPTIDVGDYQLRFVARKA
jgi:SAM-dependent methyltransferase